MAYRLAAAFTLTALLACSGLGVCWKQFARMTHHCCPGGGSDSAQVKPCASVVAHEAAVVMPPPAVATLPITLDPSGVADVPLVVDPLFRAKGPPLILRIEKASRLPSSNSRLPVNARRFARARLGDK